MKSLVVCVLLCLAVAGASFDATAAEGENQRVISVEFKGGQVIAGPQVVKLKRDDEVTLNVLSDRADELHLHGYDLHLKLQPNQTATLKFVARRTGRFSFELHTGGVELGVLEIYPK